jgi:hypothetical protein
MIRDLDHDYWTGTVYTTNRRVWEHDDGVQGIPAQDPLHGDRHGNRDGLRRRLRQRDPRARCCWSDQPMIPEGVKTEASDRKVTENFVERHIKVGIEALRLIRRHGKSVKHLRFDESRRRAAASEDGRSRRGLRFLLPFGHCPITLARRGRLAFGIVLTDPFGRWIGRFLQRLLHLAPEPRVMLGRGMQFAQRGGPIRSPAPRVGRAVAARVDVEARHAQRIAQHAGGCIEARKQARRAALGRKGALLHAHAEQDGVTSGLTDDRRMAHRPGLDQFAGGAEFDGSGQNRTPDNCCSGSA